MNSISLYFSLTLLFAAVNGYTFGGRSTPPTTSNTTPGLTIPTTTPEPPKQNDLSAREWIKDNPAQDHKKEIIKKFATLLTKEYSNREKIAIDTMKTVPEISTDLQGQSITFSNLRLDYSIDNNDYTDFNEFKCAEYLQVNISKFIQELNINGMIMVANETFKTNNKFTVSLGKTLISSIHKLQVINEQIVKVNETPGETKIKYENIKTDVEAKEEHTSIILSAIPIMLTSIKVHLHNHIDKTTLTKLNANLSLPDDFQCDSNGIGTYSTLSNNTYIINEVESDKSATHTLFVGPVVVEGFSNITEITWEYAWALNNKSYRKTVINIGSLHVTSDWYAALFGKETRDTTYFTDEFTINNAQLISVRDPQSSTYYETTTSYYGYDPYEDYKFKRDYYRQNTRNHYHETQQKNVFKVEMESSPVERIFPVLSDVLCINLDKIVSASLLKALNSFNKKD